MKDLVDAEILPTGRQECISAPPIPFFSSFPPEVRV
jgi:hypothetical protein